MPAPITSARRKRVNRTSLAVAQPGSSVRPHAKPLHGGDIRFGIQAFGGRSLVLTRRPFQQLMKTQSFHRWLQACDRETQVELSKRLPVEHWQRSKEQVLSR